MARILQRAKHLFQRIENECKAFPQIKRTYGFNVASATFKDGLVTPGKSEKYISTIQEYVDKELSSDIKNTKSYMEVMNDIEMDHIKIILNNSRDINLNYFSKYDIRSMIGRNIDYSLDRSLYIKNITSFLIEGEIFTLNKSLTFKDKNDLKKLENMARDFIEM